MNGFTPHISPDTRARQQRAKDAALYVCVGLIAGIDILAMLAWWICAAARI